MSSPNNAPRSRRVLLAGAAAGAAVLAAEALAKPLSVTAADGDPVQLGTGNAATNCTGISVGGDYGLQVIARDWAVMGRSEGGDPGKARVGVWGYSDGGSGVEGEGPTGVLAIGASQGLYGAGLAGATGVLGSSLKPGDGPFPPPAELGTGVGVEGLSGLGVGVRGRSAGVAVEGHTEGVTSEEDMFDHRVVGVAGRVKDGGSYGIGVLGDGGLGCGVLGQGGHVGVHGYGETAGVEGKSLPGVGVRAQTESGVAIAAEVSPSGSGLALQAHGPVQFDSAGRGQLVGSRATISPGVALHAGSKVLVTLMADPGLRASILYVELNPGPALTASFVVRLPGARGTIPFAYFVID